VTGSITPDNVGLLFNNPPNGTLNIIPNSTNRMSSYARIDLGSFNNGNTGDTMVSALNFFWRGNAPGLGGFYYKQIWGMRTTDPTHTIAVGMMPATGFPAPGGPIPSATLNCVFMGCDSTDTNLQIMHNDGSGTCAKIDLGANFAKNIVDAVYQLELTVASNGSTIDYVVTRLDAAFTSSGSLSANIPANTFFMRPFLLNTKKSVATLVSIAFMSCHIYTPY